MTEKQVEDLMVAKFAAKLEENPLFNYVKDHGSPKGQGLADVISCFLRGLLAPWDAAADPAHQALDEALRWMDKTDGLIAGSTDPNIVLGRRIADMVLVNEDEFRRQINGLAASWNPYFSTKRALAVYVHVAPYPAVLGCLCCVGGFANPILFLGGAATIAMTLIVLMGITF